MSFQSKFLYLLPSFVALLVGSSGLYYSTNGLNALTDEGARRYIVDHTQPQLPEFVLEDMSSNTIVVGGTAIPKHDISIVEFIYTSCPTICQTSGAYFARLRDKIEGAGLSSRVRLLSVSFDPENDLVPHLADYAELHGADGEVWNVARINKEDLARLKDSFGVIIIADELGAFQHNSGMHIINSSGKLVAIHDLEDIDGVLQWLVD